MLIIFGMIISLFSTINSFSYIPKTVPKTKVYIHLEKFNERYNLLHIGISFNNLYNNVRYDFRATDIEIDKIEKNNKFIEKKPIYI